MGRGGRSLRGTLDRGREDGSWTVHEMLELRLVLYDIAHAVLYCTVDQKVPKSRSLAGAARQRTSQYTRKVLVCLPWFKHPFLSRPRVAGPGNKLRIGKANPSINQ